MDCRNSLVLPLLRDLSIRRKPHASSGTARTSITRPGPIDGESSGSPPQSVQVTTRPRHDGPHLEIGGPLLPRRSSTEIETLPPRKTTTTIGRDAARSCLTSIPQPHSTQSARSPLRTRSATRWRCAQSRPLTQAKRQRERSRAAPETPSARPWQQRRRTRRSASPRGALSARASHQDRDLPFLARQASRRCGSRLLSAASRAGGTLSPRTRLQARVRSAAGLTTAPATHASAKRSRPRHLCCRGSRPVQDKRSHARTLSPMRTGVGNPARPGRA